jgi:hypothetical protein
VHRGVANDTRTLRHISIAKGIIVETTGEVTENAYTVTNAADETRAVLVEHARQNGAELASDTKPVETTPSIYRFKVVVEPHQSAELRVKERSTIAQQIVIDPDNDQTAFLIETAKLTPQLAAQLKPLIDAETALSALNGKLEENDQKQKSLADDEARDRDNLTALKGNDAAKRFVDELNQAEDAIQTARKDQADLEKQRDAAQEGQARRGDSGAAREAEGSEAASRMKRPWIRWATPVRLSTRWRSQRFSRRAFPPSAPFHPASISANRCVRAALRGESCPGFAGRSWQAPAPPPPFPASP